VYRKVLLMLVLCTLGLAVAACGSDDEESASSGGGSEESAEKLKVGLVTDIGGLDDRGFNQLAYEGLKRAEKDFGVEIRAITSTKGSDYIPNLTTLARQKYDLIVANGFLMAEATEKMANTFKDAQFAIIDASAEGMKSKPKNVHGLLFKENEIGYVVGYMAGLYTKDKGDEKVVSVVGGQKVPAVDAYLAGYAEGAKAADSGIKVLTDYSQSFTKQATCKEIALDQIAQGSQVVFAAAGGCGLGSLDAAKQEQRQAIGVDKEQGFLGPQMMTSAIKKVDAAVYDAVEQMQKKTYKGGVDTVYDIKSGGVGLGKVSAAGKPFLPEVEQVQKDIADGKVTDIPTQPQ
jgi:basic membrane protein A and related proteins